MVWRAARSLVRLQLQCALSDARGASAALVADHWACTQGDSAAARQLGFLYVHGQGVPCSYVQALTWFERAVS